MKIQFNLTKTTVVAVQNLALLLSKKDPVT